MSFFVHNTMTRTKEEFIPIDGKTVRMYTCGPTVYNYAHIGNFRAYVFEDLLRRYIKFCGYNVIQVQNLTDVDDKTILGSINAGTSLKEFTSKYIKAFHEDLKLLNIEPEVYKGVIVSNSGKISSYSNAHLSSSSAFNALIKAKITSL